MSVIIEQKNRQQTGVLITQKSQTAGGVLITEGEPTAIATKVSGLLIESIIHPDTINDFTTKLDQGISND